MSNKKKETRLTWEDFQAFGNPENVEESEIEKDSEYNYQVRVRIYKDRKKRKGKTATLIEGLKESGMDLLELAKKLKSHCGVGGSLLEEDIILLQGDQMEKSLKYLLTLGFTDCKLSGG